MAMKNIYYIPLSSDILNVFFQNVCYLFESGAENYRTRVMFLTHPTKNDRLFLNINGSKAVFTGILTM